MPVTARVEGSESLRRKLAALTEAVSGQMLERATVAAALIVQNAAKQDSPYRTGNLRRSIHIGGHEGLAGDFQITTGSSLPAPEVTPNRVTVLVGTNVEYAARLEYGFADTDSLGRVYNQEAQPYLRPAIDENQAAIQREFGEALSELMRGAV